MSEFIAVSPDFNAGEPLIDIDISALTSLTPYEAHRVVHLLGDWGYLANDDNGFYHDEIDRLANQHLAMAFYGRFA